MAERLSAPDFVPLSPPPNPLAEVVTRAESVLAEALELQPVTNANEEAATSNPSPLVEPVGEVIRGVAIKTLIDFEEEPAVVADTNIPT